MTFDELIEKINTYFGIRPDLYNPTAQNCKLVISTPTGVELLTILIENFDYPSPKGWLVSSVCGFQQAKDLFKMDK